MHKAFGNNDAFTTPADEEFHHAERAPYEDIEDFVARGSENSDDTRETPKQLFRKGQSLELLTRWSSRSRRDVENPNPKEAFGITDKGIDFMTRQVIAGKPFHPAPGGASSSTAGRRAQGSGRLHRIRKNRCPTKTQHRQYFMNTHGLSPRSQPR
jgi:hypothetical protein